MFLNFFKFFNYPISALKNVDFLTLLACRPNFINVLSPLRYPMNLLQLYTGVLKLIDACDLCTLPLLLYLEVIILHHSFAWCVFIFTKAFLFPRFNLGCFFAEDTSTKMSQDILPLGSFFLFYKYLIGSKLTR